jgi:phospholipid/cholesterol/gamma-HCH transport system permease protein
MFPTAAQSRHASRLPFQNVQMLGLHALNLTYHLGQLAIFTFWIGVCLVTPPFRFRRLVQELYKQGVLSVVIVCVCGMAVGMVISLQAYTALVDFGMTGALGAWVGQSLIRELGPVITGLLVTGRAGSATAAEIGSMVVTEQLDGLRMMAIDPIHFIVTPKALAMFIAVPLLTALFIVCGIYGGYLVGVGLMHADAGAYMSSLRDSSNIRVYIAGSVVKSLVFALLIGLISTFRGYTSARTAEGVSAATTSTVVITSVSILLFDFVVTALWKILWGVTA